ncbi:uncharacterized protein LOC130613547 [Hydractinia symbiolongicarpus]|uniref:uncharacterized protein LOC130613547 n=1 Tax=Hydractinia symbiolongicarpus TaxID=13093 RepID=UPI002551C666|nr:uncharacterized protein LOC130613547 [Hydractinia symbiolongicarpus]
MAAKTIVCHVTFRPQEYHQLLGNIFYCYKNMYIIKETFVIMSSYLNCLFHIEILYHSKKLFIMPSVNCAVIGCFNSTKKLRKWKKERCEIHEVNHEECSCQRPFSLYCFPSVLRNYEQRQRWIKAMRRINPDKSDWVPKQSDRVCSVHFVDGTPSQKYPDPTLELGYDTPVTKKPRRELFRHSLEKSSLDSENVPSNEAQEEEPCCSNISDASGFFSPTIPDHSYTISSPPTCESCKDKSEMIKSLVSKVNSLTVQVKKYRGKAFEIVKNTTMTWRIIKSDSKMNYYTGLSSIMLFNTLLLLLKPYLQQVNYWRGSKRACLSTKIKCQTKHVKKLTQRDEFLLVLMKLRLGLLTEDLADRFGISPSTCSTVFVTWIRIISRVLGDALVVWLPREAIRDNLPKTFAKAGYSKCRVIIDCAEVFIDRPKSLTNQASTWSDYKHHNTLKFLVGISPSGYITFLSDCYGGRASDKFITNDSGFYDLLEGMMKLWQIVDFKSEKN